MTYAFVTVDDLVIVLGLTLVAIMGRLAWRRYRYESVPVTVSELLVCGHAVTPTERPLTPTPRGAIATAWCSRCHATRRVVGVETREVTRKRDRSR